MTMTSFWNHAWKQIFFGGLLVWISCWAAPLVSVADDSESQDSPAVQTDDGTSSQSPSFLVMSFNIRMCQADDGENNWELRKETLLEEIQETNPLLLGVQEACPAQMEYLNAQLTGYGSIGVGRDDGKKKGEFSAIFYQKEFFDVLDSGTFWLSETPDQAGVKGWDAACNRIVSWGKFRCKETGLEFIYANTHFDHRGETARIESAKLILTWKNKVADQLPFIISGDFNVTDKSEAYKILTQGFEQPDGTWIKGLADSRKKAMTFCDSSEPLATYHGFRKIPEGKNSIIDFIFVSEDMPIKSFTISPSLRHGRFPSDHRSIIAEIQ